MDEQPQAMIRIFRLKIPVPADRNILVEYADFQLYRKKDQYEYLQLARLNVPCRSNLYKLLAGLLFEKEWNFQGDKEVPEKHVKVLQIMFENKKDYEFWRKGVDILHSEGKEKTWEWIHEQIPLLKLRNKLEGHE